jgi:hypothetical protein
MGPRSPWRGATPPQAASCWRVRIPNAGRASRHGWARPGPLPVARCNRSSLSRHSRLARRSVSRSWSSGAMAAWRHVLGAVMSCVRHSLVPARRCCAAVRMPSRGWRRPRRARTSCVWAAGSGRGGGRITAAPGASARAANASVVAHGPVARAPSRAGRGWTTTPGRPAAAHAAVAARARPPMASRPLRVGWRAGSRSTSGARPRASWGTAQRSPAGRRAISPWACAPSIPTPQGTSLLRTPVRPTWPIRAPWPQTPGRALGVQNVTPHAPLQSRWPKAQLFPAPTRRPRNAAWPCLGRGGPPDHTAPKHLRRYGGPPGARWA